MRGFGSDVSAVAHAGSTICDLADELSGDAVAWSDAEARDPAAFGVTELTDGLQAARVAWRAEFDVYVDVLSHWCTAMQRSPAIIGARIPRIPRRPLDWAPADRAQSEATVTSADYLQLSNIAATGYR